MITNRLRQEGTSFTDRLRGMSTPAISVQPISTPAVAPDIQQEITQLKGSGTPLHQIFKAIDSEGMGEEVKKFARKLYFGVQQN